jgi:hypothetical protein
MAVAVGEVRDGARPTAKAGGTEGLRESTDPLRGVDGGRRPYLRQRRLRVCQEIRLCAHAGFECSSATPHVVRRARGRAPSAARQGASPRLIRSEILQSPKTAQAFAEAPTLLRDLRSRGYVAARFLVVG